MKLEDCHADDLVPLTDWFESPEALLRWGGPKVRWPLDHAGIVEDVLRSGLHSRIARGDGGELIAFGQFYRKLDRCHLARIAVAPARRGQGLGRRLVRGLMDEGVAALGVRACSLYVLADNAPAIGAYRACGFVFAEDPEPMPALPDCLFMIADPAVSSP